MNFSHKFSIRAGVPIVIFSLYSALLLLTLLYNQQTFNSAVEEDGFLEVKAEVAQLKQVLSMLIRRNAVNGVNSFITKVAEKPHVNNISLVDINGVVIYSTKQLMKGRDLSSLYPKVAAQLLAGLDPKKGSNTLLNDAGASILSLQQLNLPLVEGLQSDFKLLLDYELSNIKEKTWQMLLTNTISSWLIGLSILLSCMLFLEVFINKPLARIANNSKDFMVGKWSIRANKKGVKEVAEIAKNFNEMAESVSVSYQELQQKTALYNILRASNQSINRSGEENTLLLDICQLITTLGGFNFAWIGLFDDNSGDLSPVASSNLSIKTLQQLHTAIDSSSNWLNSIAAKAVFQKKTVVCNDVFAEEVNYPPELTEIAKELRVHSIASFPLIIEGEVIGALTISNFEAHYFSEEFISLLSEVAKDVSFGISNFRKEKLSRHSALLLASQQSVAEQIASGVPIADIFATVTSEIDRLLSDQRISSAFWVVKENKLHFISGSGLPSDYRERVDGLDITLEKAPSMDAVVLKKRLKAELFNPKVDDKLAPDLKSCISTPVRLIDSEVFGVLDIYYEANSVPTENDLSIIDRFVYLTRLAFERERGLESIRQREENFAVTLDSIGDAVITVNTKGYITRINPVAIQMTGWSSKDALGQPLEVVFRIINTQTRRPVNNSVNDVISCGEAKGSANHTSLISRDGKEYQISDNAAPILDSSGELRGVILVFQNISENYAIQEDLRRSNERLGAFNSVLPDIALILNSQGVFMEIHGSDTQRLSIEKRSKMIGLSVFEIPSVPEKLAAKMLTIIKKTLLTQQNQIFEYSLETELGLQILEARVAVLTGKPGVPSDEVVWLARDITDRKKVETENELLAFYDPLTKIPNRRLLMDRLSHEISIVKRHNSQLAVLFLDLDHFKTLNDSLGHSIGDSLLEQVAQRLSQQVRAEDTVARLGGDEFIVLLSELNKAPDLAAQEAGMVAEKIKAVLAEPFLLYEHEHHISVSIGISLFATETDSTADDVLKHADNAMYKAKSSGRNQVCFYRPEMQATADKRLKVEKNLREAIKNNDLIPYYQPQVKADGSCIGLEVLLRWDEPKEGIISPADFIPVAEESGLVLPIGELVLEKSCEQIKYWYDSGIFGHKGEHFAVNISPKQFSQADFVGQVTRILDKVGIPPQLLYLEITEGMVIDNLEEVIEKMNLLREVGVQFSMDDFGTGYSSLSYLKRLPLQQLKIDRSFIRDIATDANDRAIIDVILAVSERLKLNVVAEGVETKKQVSFLTKRKCHAFQGFFFAKPMSAGQLEDWLKEQQVA